MVVQGAVTNGEYRLLVSSSPDTSVFSPDFLNAVSSSTNNTNTSTEVALNRTHAGTAVDVYSVSSSLNINASTLCKALSATSGDIQTNSNVTAEHSSSLCMADCRLSSAESVSMLLVLGLSLFKFAPVLCRCYLL